MSDIETLYKQSQILSTFLSNYTSSKSEQNIAQALDKLARLSHLQFSELSLDMTDEIQRRVAVSLNKDAPPFLLVNQAFHPKRNQIRQKLATLGEQRFKELAMDTFLEAKRRLPKRDVAVDGTLQVALVDSETITGEPDKVKASMLSTKSFDALICDNSAQIEGLDHIMTDLGQMMNSSADADTILESSLTTGALEKSVSAIASSLNLTSLNNTNNKSSTTNVADAAESVKAILDMQKEKHAADISSTHESNVRGRVRVKTVEFADAIQCENFDEDAYKRELQSLGKDKDLSYFLDLLKTEGGLSKKQLIIIAHIHDTLSSKKINTEEVNSSDISPSSTTSDTSSPESDPNSSSSDGMKRAFSMTLDVSRFLKSTDSLFKVTRADKNDQILHKFADVTTNTNAIVEQAAVTERRLIQHTITNSSMDNAAIKVLISGLKEASSKTSDSLGKVSILAHKFSAESSKDLLNTFDLTVGHLISAVVELAQRIKKGQTILDEDVKNKFISAAIAKSQMMPSLSIGSMANAIGESLPISLHKSPSTYDLTTMLEVKTEEIVRGIQKLLTALKTDSSSLSAIIHSITAAVQVLLNTTNDAISTDLYSGLSKHVTKISSDLSTTSKKFSSFAGNTSTTNGASGEDAKLRGDKGARQMLALCAYDLAKETKELVALFEK